MANIQLGDFAVNEIRESMKGLCGKPAKAEALRLAKIHGVSWQHIYKKTEDIRPKNKTRADKGKSKWELKEGEDVWAAFELLTVDKYN